MFDKIKSKIGYWLLDKKAAKVKREVKFINLNDAKEIALIANIDGIDKYKIISEFIGWLRNKGKTVYVVAFVENDEFKNFFSKEKSILFFNKKNITWYGKPRNVKYNDFIDKEFDILIDTSLNQIITFHYLVALSKAKMKVGKYSEKYDYYDFVIDVGDNNDFAYFINQIKHYLCELNKNL
jgi:hypothetical protein